MPATAIVLEISLSLCRLWSCVCDKVVHAGAVNDNGMLIYKFKPGK